MASESKIRTGRLHNAADALFLGVVVVVTVALAFQAGVEASSDSPYSRDESEESASAPNLTEDEEE